MKHLNIDIETYSSISVKDVGLYRYAEDDSFEVLLFAYSVDFGEVKIVDLARGEKVPSDIIEAMADDGVIKHAYNAAFEYNCLKRAGYEVGSRLAWHCTLLHAMYLGYPGGLALTGKAVGLPDDKKKSSTGTALINYFSVPCKPTKANGGRSRNLPHHDEDKWQLFKDYCCQDIVAEMEIYKRLADIQVPDIERQLWALTDEMNSVGVGVDMEVVEGALDIDDNIKKKLSEKAKKISGCQNINSNVQIKSYLNSVVPGGVEDTTKATISSLLSRTDLEPDVLVFLKIRQELAKTSLTKYAKMQECVCSDGRVRGLLQHYGANRTGRWAGRLVQVQNLPRNYINHIGEARELAKDKDELGLQMLYGNVTDTLSQLIRTAFVPKPGNKFVVADYSAIEARVVAWLAGEEWVNEVFATHGKIYEATASQMFNVPIEKIKKGNPEYELRQRGKVATLALGYQGGVNALKAMGADKMGLSEDEMTGLVELWRQANPNIKNLWYSLERACIEALSTGEPQEVRGLKVSYVLTLYGLTYLAIQLPSGRSLYYPSPSIGVNAFDRKAVHFKTADGVRWVDDSTYGGKLTENVVQAIARDCLGYLLLKLKNEIKDPVVMHIHDEVVVDASPDLTVEHVCEIMGEPIPWAPGLNLKGAGFESDFYMKD